MGPLYVITDADAPRPVQMQARAAAEGGAWAVQLRDKRATTADRIRTARQLKELLLPLGCRLIVNDDPEAALAADADGLHVGQGDGDHASLARRLPDGMILGVSIEAAHQLAALTGRADYIGVGPVRATSTKPDHAAPVGMDGLADICAAAPVPVFAIGGLSASDAGPVRGAGAVGMAVVSAVTRADDMAGAARDIVTAWRKA